MKTIMSVLFILSTLFFVSACKTMDVRDIQPISIPSKLTQQEVKDSIVNAVNPDGKPTELKHKRYFGPFAQTSSSQGFWYIEDVKDSSVVVGFNNGKHSFSTEYLITGSQITKQILSSQNLKQSANSIHKAVFGWLDQLDAKIKQNMGYLVSTKRVNTSL